MAGRSGVILSRPKRNLYRAGAFPVRATTIKWTNAMGLILIILLVIFLFGGFSGRFGGYGYGYGHAGVGIPGIIIIILVVLLLMGRL
jgi:hypothetical protein